MSMAEIDRLSERIAWIDLSFVERDRTPRWAVEVGIRCHLAGMSLREVSKFLEIFLDQPEPRCCSQLGS
ncbi:transposase [Halorubrum sp. AJ67]|nr:transposase [Halorubrum sp. AJ67]